MVWGKAGSTTLTAGGNAMTVSSLPNSVFGMALGKHTAGGTDIKLNGDTDSNYAVRRNVNGSSSENYNTNVSDAYITDSRGYPHFNVTYLCNISGEEKLWINHNVHESSGGASVATTREEAVGKWTGTGVVTSFEYHNWAGSTYASGDNVSVLGDGVTPAEAIPFGSAVSDVPDYTRAEITDTRRMYTKYPEGWFVLGTVYVPPPPKRGIWGGGYTSAWGSSNAMYYVTISTTANATDFGDLTVARPSCAGVGSDTRGCFAGGESYSDVIDYITIQTTGNATDFGNLSVGRQELAGTSDSTRGLFMGGNASGTSNDNVIDYITMATTGNATNFGDTTTTPRYNSGACASSTRAILFGGQAASPVDIIDYVTIQTTGNATDFGNLSVGRMQGGAVSDATRGVYMGGFNAAVAMVNTIDYVTISTTGNATDFGDLSSASGSMSATGDSTRGVFGSHRDNVGFTAAMGYITIATTGNATSFGDASTTTAYNGALSDYVK